MTTRRTRGTVTLRVHRRGHYQLVDARRRPIPQANRFLAAAVVRGLSRATVRAYGFDLVVLYRWLAARRLTLASLTEDTLLHYLGTLRQVGAQPATLQRRLSTAQLLYRFCTGRDLVPYRGISTALYFRRRRRDRYLGLHLLPRRRQLRLRVKVPHRVVEPLSGAEVRYFLRSLRRYRDVALVHLMLLCGLRSAEVLQLRRSDVLLEEVQLRVHGKGNRERVLPLPPVVARSITDYLRWERPARATSPRLFVILQGPRRGLPMTMAGLRSLFRHRRRDPIVARANPHRFRHTFGADMARAGVRLPILQRLMGHADDATTLRYIQLSMDDVAVEYKRVVEQIHRRYRTPR